jgi:hypothetical protein
VQGLSGEDLVESDEELVSDEMQNSSKWGWSDVPILLNTRGRWAWMSLQKWSWLR